MDQLKSFVSKGLEEMNKTGGTELNKPHDSNQGSASPELNSGEVLEKTKEHGSGESSLFESALTFLTSNKDEHAKPLDESHVTDAHKKVYDEGKGGDVSADAIGYAAAMQVLKGFISGDKSGDGSGDGSDKGKGSSQSHLVSMAMAEASKLFDKNPPNKGTKQDAVNSAGMTFMKLFVQSKFTGSSTIGGESSGGLSGLMKMAQKFTK